MTASIRLLETEDAKNLPRQIAATTPMVVLVGCLIAIATHGFNAVLAGLIVVCAIVIANVFRWCPPVLESIRERRPLKMKVYFSHAPWGTFNELMQATLYDPRRFDPFKQTFRQKWELAPAQFDTNSLVGDAQDCLVYVDRDTGKVLAFATAGGALFPVPYLMPWNKVDTSTLILSGQAANFDAIE